MRFEDTEPGGRSGAEGCVVKVTSLSSSALVDRVHVGESAFCVGETSVRCHRHTVAVRVAEQLPTLRVKMRLTKGGHVQLKTHEKEKDRVDCDPTVMGKHFNLIVDPRKRI